MWGTLIALLILAFYQSTKLFTIPSRKSVLPGYLPMGIILLFGILALNAKETDRVFSAQQVMSTAIGKNAKPAAEKNCG